MRRRGIGGDGRRGGSVGEDDKNRELTGRAKSSVTVRQCDSETLRKLRTGSTKDLAELWSFFS